MNNDSKPVSIYYDYIKSHLPDYVPDDAIKQCLNNDNYVRGLNYYIYYDPGKAPAQLAYIASNEEDLKRKIFEDVTYSIARYLQSLNVEEEQISNPHFDFEKLVREYHLNLLKSQLSQGQLNLIIKRYEYEINRYSKIQCWKFDKEKFKFVDINS